MGRRINCGSFWTVLSTECWLRKRCDGCAYKEYCERGVNGRRETPIIKRVVDQLLDKFGKPPRKLIKMAKEQTMNPVIL